MFDDHPVDDYDVRFPAHLGAVADARHRFESWLTERSVNVEIVSEMSVVFSELAANAVEASSARDNEVAARAWCESDELVLEMTNIIRYGSAPVVDWDLEDPLRGGGRGLLIVKAYTDVVELIVADEALSVRCRRHVFDEERAIPS